MRPFLFAKAARCVATAAMLTMTGNGAVQAQAVTAEEAKASGVDACIFSCTDRFLVQDTAARQSTQPAHLRVSRMRI